MDQKLWLLRLTTAAGQCDLVQGQLSLAVNFGWEEQALVEGGTIFAIYNENRDFLANLAKVIIDQCPGAEAELRAVDNKDWTSAWREFFTPVECGSRFVILPPWLAHFEHSTRKQVIIEPKTAFGTGHHASTRLCLAALSDLLDAGKVKRNGWFLDLGCGTGVLGIAACKAGMDGTGLDIDPLAIANARENRELNEATRLELLKGGLEKVRKEKFDLIMANILAGPLIEMAPRILASLKKDSCLILGGILGVQAEAVASAYAALGKPRIFGEDEWVALVWAGGQG